MQAAAEGYFSLQNQLTAAMLFMSANTTILTPPGPVSPSSSFLGSSLSLVTMLMYLR